MNTSSRIGRWSVIIGIVIVLNLFFNYALSLVYKAPKFEAYCPVQQVQIAPNNQNECVAQGGQWSENSYQKPTAPGELVSTGYCNINFTCGQNFNTANEAYNRNVFIVLVVLGAISVVIGNFYITNEVIASGLSLAGVLSFVIASVRYWGSANDAIRVVILAIALALLFWVAYKRFGNRNAGIPS